jgi:hypothetical protein
MIFGAECKSPFFPLFIVPGLDLLNKAEFFIHGCKLMEISESHQL